MSSLATMILSGCSAAISSSTGATILHGPHQVAQKSTRTGFSLVSTSSAKVLSVTVTVLPAMVSPVSGLRLPGSVDADREVTVGNFRGNFGAFGEPPFRVDGRGTAGSGRGDGLTVGAVHQVACREHTVQVGVGGAADGAHVAVRVRVHLAQDQLAARVV